MEIRTSLTHPLQIDPIQMQGISGQIGLTLCPGKRGPSSLSKYSWDRDLATDVQVIADWGPALWLCLMEPAEMQKHGVVGLPAAAAGIATYVNLPIRDVHTPGTRFESIWQRTAPLVHDALTSGRKVLIHCRGGLGRAGTVAARILVEFGYEPDEAIQSVRAARKGAIETPAQEDYVRSLRRQRGIARAVPPLRPHARSVRTHDTADRACGGLLGLLIGDALGVPHEFKQASAIPPIDQIELMMPPDYTRSYPQVPDGTWSDDGAQTLCLLESLAERGNLDLDDLGGRLLNWARNGHMAVDGKVFDIGCQTSRALDRLEAGAAAPSAGKSDATMIGNGSLMRVLGLALWHKGSIDSLFRDAMHQSKVTHAPIEAQLCCALYCGVAYWLLKGLEMDEAWLAAESELRRYCKPNAQESQLLSDRILRSRYRSNPTGSGYVVDALWSARACLRECDYTSVVRTAVAMGNDTDTTAALAGGLAGIAFTQRGIPDRWLNALRGQTLVSPILEGIRKRHCDNVSAHHVIENRKTDELLRATIAQHGIGPRQHFGNLSVYPLIATCETAATYTLLDEALAQGSATVTEISEAGHVPELAFANKGKQPVLLIDGQELQGARQNRALNLTILAEPESELVIPVACVERGRWAYRKRHLEASRHMLFRSARAARARAVSESMRQKNGAKADQQELWDHIEKQLRSANQASETDAMADLYQRHDALLAGYQDAFNWLPNQAGAVFAVNGDPVAIELFDSPQTYRRSMEKLIRSFSVETAQRTDTISDEPTLSSVQAFLARISQCPTHRSKAVGAGEDLRLDSRVIAGGALVVNDRVVHLSALCV